MDFRMEIDQIRFNVECLMEYDFTVTEDLTVSKRFATSNDTALASVLKKMDAEQNKLIKLAVLAGANNLKVQMYIRATRAYITEMRNCINEARCARLYDEHANTILGNEDIIFND